MLVTILTQLLKMGGRHSLDYVDYGEAATSDAYGDNSDDNIDPIVEGGGDSATAI